MNQLSQAEQDAAEYAQIVKREAPASVGFVLRKLVWGVALAAIFLSAAESFASFELQTGAPQQAASAAYACFRLIAVYVAARAIDELSRGTQGV